MQLNDSKYRTLQRWGCLCWDGCLCGMGACAGWVLVRDGCLCRMGACAGWVLVQDGCLPGILWYSVMCADCPSLFPYIDEVQRHHGPELQLYTELLHY